jgi:hypothetical protein
MRRRCIVTGEPSLAKPGSPIDYSNRWPAAVAHPLMYSWPFVSKNSTLATLSNVFGSSFGIVIAQRNALQPTLESGGS